jgi:DNA-binding CsgD family transcriptional regulator
MDKLYEIVRARTAPGILIFDLSGRLLYSNQRTLEMFEELHAGEQAGPSLTEKIFNLCHELNSGTGTPHALQENNPRCPLLTDALGRTYAFRSFLIGDHGKENGDSHLLVLIERVVKQHTFDIEMARKEFQLSKREGDVVSLICQGLSNKDISKTIFISEYTVKVHIRNIMKKMKASSRNEIIALL